MNLRIKSVRKHFNKTQKEFGESLGVSRDTFASYESGRVKPSKTFVQLLCTTYHINEVWLSTGEGDMPAQTVETFLDGLCSRFDISHYALKVVECYLNMDKEQQDAIDAFFDSFVEACNAGTSAEHAVDRAIHMFTPNIMGASAADADSPLTLEEEADKFAQMARQQFVSEKKRASQASFAKKSSAV